jgi:methyl-accepting chemotaxis protein/methyl-accepting chemotaxis protein-1 (serine sensor receptor)
MKNLTIGTRIWTLLAASWLLGAGSTVFLYMHMRSLVGSYEQLFSHDVHDQDSARQMQIAFKRQVQSWKDVLLRGKDPESARKYAAEFDAQEAVVQKIVAQLGSSVTDPAAQRLLMEFGTEHKQMGAAYHAQLNTFIAAQGANAEAVDAALKGIDRKPSDLVDQAGDSIVKSVEAQRAGIVSDLSIFALAVAGLFGFLAVICALTVRSINRTLAGCVSVLSDSAVQVSSAATQIASTSQSLSQGSSEQAASLEEVSASMEEMTAMTRRNAENSAEATAMMAETVSQVDRSNSALHEMMASMGAIKQSSEKVARINKTIDEIAFQTNILALNAAVEAARAGEAGMGFAVVADEVRNLAQRSAVAARDTADLIEEAITNTSQGATKLDQVASAIRAITDSAAKVKTLVDEVNEASKQQTQGISEVASAVVQVSAVTQTAAASAEESAAASQELSAQSQTVSDLVRQLGSLVGATSDIADSEERHHAPQPTAHSAPKRAPVADVRPMPATTEDPFPMEATGTGSFRSF